jgi:hypothetical protein
MKRILRWLKPCVGLDGVSDTRLLARAGKKPKESLYTLSR